MNDGFPRTDKILWKGKIDASRQRQTQAKTVTRACIQMRPGTQKTLQGACTSRANPTPGPSVSPVMGPRGGS